MGITALNEQMHCLTLAAETSEYFFTSRLSGLLMSPAPAKQCILITAAGRCTFIVGKKISSPYKDDYKMKKRDWRKTMKVVEIRPRGR